MKIHLWNPETREIKLATYEDSAMARDGKTETFYRFKSYAKDEEKLMSERLRPFPQPYQVAAHYCGGDWNRYVTPFAIQVVNCNLNCRWCYVPPELRQGTGKYYSVETILDEFAKTESGILRVTGGEPFLAPEFFYELASRMLLRFKKSRYLWIDTNLLGCSNYGEVVQRLSAIGQPFGIVGCFKGLTKFEFADNVQMRDEPERAYELYEQQFVNAKAILDGITRPGELFFYLTEFVMNVGWWDVLGMIRQFIERMRNEIHDNAPLRTTVISLNQYESNKGGFPSIRFPTGLTREIWEFMMANEYSTSLIWLPQHLVSLGR